MRELENGWAQLASEVDGTGLAPAADVRRAADERARRRIAVVTGAVAVALVATGVAAFARPGPPPPGPTTPPSPTTTQTPSASPTPTTAPSTPPAVTSVPDGAFLVVPAESRRDSTGIDSVPADEQVPALCDNPLRAGPTMTVRRAKKTWYGGPEDPFGTTLRGSVAQTISVYEPGGAVAAMGQLRTELDSCHTRSDETGDVTFTTQQRPSDGDDGVYLVETFQTTKEGYHPDKWAEHVAVVRVGDVITVLRVGVFEGGFPDRADVDLFTRLAVDTINDWR